MSEYIQVGVTAMRDPITGGFLPSVPLYIRAEDREKVETPVFDDSVIQGLKEKFAAYKKAERAAKKAERKKPEQIEQRIEEMLAESRKGGKAEWQDTNG